MRPLLLVISLLAIAFEANAKTTHHEKEYQKVWCEKSDGITEVVLQGKSRVDCLTLTHAVEVEFGRKWQEAIGQALYYAKKTGRAPGIVLIMEGKEDNKYLSRLIYTVKKNYPFIRVWTIRPKDLGVE